MGATYLTDLADRARAAGLTVVELDGWQTRSRSSGGYDGAPWCVMWHHTASNGDGAADADYETFRADARPVCNVNVGRDGTLYVCAAGATNTNGKGGPYRLPDGRTVAADAMNTRAVGMELSNDGVGMMFPAAQLHTAFTFSTLVTGAYIDGRHDNVVQHVDWAPTRKIDPATAGAIDPAFGWAPRSTNANGSWNLDDLRAKCVAWATPTPEDPDMYLANLNGNVVVVGSAVRPVSAAELAGPLAALPMVTPTGDWYTWLEAGRREYAARMGIAV